MTACIFSVCNLLGVKMLFYTSPDAYPKLAQHPLLSGPVVQSNDFFFKCLVPYPPNKTDAIFDITWLSDGKPTSLHTLLNGNQREAFLYGHELQALMNSDISCQVEATFADKRTNKTSPPSVSNAYWAGVKVKYYPGPVCTKHLK